ncbi:MAG: 3-dehydroquinate synthase [Legionella sp.]|nr:MAG: 3-dehydroquinate synthase [Legionella sp.]PJD99388.1 MAG: 3-dehydroquinate synthase [Legionella sp.]
MAKLEVHAQVPIAVDNKYSVSICSDAFNSPGFLRTLVLSQQVLIVTNHTVAPHYLSFLQTAFSDRQCDTVILPDGEEHKNQRSLFTIYDALVEKKYHRDAMLIALGGGVIGDLAGFAAATYQRGIAYLQMPTSLLAQVDASVGGKTAINHSLGKNMIGSFYHPCSVIIDVNTLKTLPDREFKAGVAEIIKYGLLEGGDFFVQLQQLIRKGLSFDTKELPSLIAACCAIKARFVVADEKEQGVRALLNLGHTVAHALETLTQYSQWLHGEAVGIGLYCAMVLSFQLGVLDECWVTEVALLLQEIGLPHKIPKEIQLDELIKLIGTDKKIKNGRLRFILMRKPGACYIESEITPPMLEKALAASIEKG